MLNPHIRWNEHDFILASGYNTSSIDLNIFENLRGLDSQFKSSLIFEFSNDWRLDLRSNFYRFRESWYSFLISSSFGLRCFWFEIFLKVMRPPLHSLSNHILFTGTRRRQQFLFLSFNDFSQPLEIFHWLLWVHAKLLLQYFQNMSY